MSEEVSPPKSTYRLIYGEDRRVGEWVAARTNGEWREGGRCIGWERNGELIAGMLTDWHNGASIYMHVAGEGPHWLKRDFLYHCFYYVFVQLGCKVAIGLVPSINLAAIRFDKHLGFVELARIPDGHPSGDLVILTITKAQAQHWLELKEAA